jgi:hypothetical protein
LGIQRIGSKKNVSRHRAEQATTTYDFATPRNSKASHVFAPRASAQLRRFVPVVAKNA